MAAFFVLVRAVRAPLCVIEFKAASPRPLASGTGHRSSTLVSGRELKEANMPAIPAFVLIGVPVVVVGGGYVIYRIIGG
jgi:hypothetical protein